MNGMTRYFLDRDSSCHWYLVRADRRAEWDAWCDLNEDDECSWVVPRALRIKIGSRGDRDYL